MSISNFKVDEGRCTCYLLYFFLHGTYHTIIKLMILQPLLRDPKISEVMEKQLNILQN